MNQQVSNDDEQRDISLASPPWPYDFAFNLLREVEQNLENLQDSARIHDLNALINNIEAMVNEEIQFLEANRQLTGEAITEALNLRRHKFSAIVEAGKEDHCPICLDEFANDEFVAKLDCDHIYDMDCIKEWLERNNTCPLCRQTAVPIV